MNVHLPRGRRRATRLGNGGRSWGLLALVVVALCSACSGSGTSPRHAVYLALTFRPPSLNSENGRVELLDARGRRLRVLSRSAASAVWSPDGRRIALAGRGLLLVDADAGGSRRLAAGNFVAAFFSDDGDRLAALRLDGPDPDFDPADSYKLVIVDLHDGRARVAASGVDPLAWAPRKALLVRAGDGRIGMMQPDGGEVRFIRGKALAATWSPDGRRLALLVGSINNPAVVVTDDAGRGRQTVWRGTRRVSPSTLDQWSSDGWILFTRETFPHPAWVSDADDLHTHVFAVRPDGTGLHRLPGPARTEQAFISIRPD